MTFLPNPAYDALANSERASEISPGYLNNPYEMIVDEVDFNSASTFYEYINMDGFDCVIVQVECETGSGGPDQITFYWYETLDPVSDPTGAGVQWTASSGLWSATSISNASSVIDRVDTQTDNSTAWYRLGYARTYDSGGTTRDFQVKVKKWKRGS